jgi:hypothetical protein
MAKRIKGNSPSINSTQLKPVIASVFFNNIWMIVDLNSNLAATGFQW